MSEETGQEQSQQQQEDKPVISNLIDATGVEKEAEANEADQVDKNAEAQQNWYWTDGVRGEGDKPDWLLPKYKSAEEQAKAYVDAQKRFGGFTGAPKDGYDMSFLDEKIVIDKNSAAFNQLIEKARNMNMSQEGLQDILSLYADYEIARTPKIEEEVQKLGTDGKQQLAVLNQWAKNNLSEEDYNLMCSKIRTAEDAKIFLKMRELAKEQPIPTAKNQTIAKTRTIAAIQQEIQDNYQKYKDDESYREKLKAEMQELI